MKRNQTKTYTVSVSIEASCQFEVKASSVKEAKAKAQELAETSIEIVFDGECQSPESSILPILDDAVDEE
jgi:hypothetical protein